MAKNDIPFVHLHCHTGFSLLDGANKVKNVTQRAAEMGMKGLAITDHGVMYGVIDFYQQAHKNGIKPIIGCETYMSYGRMHERKTEEGTGSQSNHQLLLAEDNTGYQNLIYLVSKGQLEGFYYKPRIDMELLAERSKGLIATSSCLKGKIPEAIVRGDMKKALALTGQFIDIFGKENFYLELQDHGLEEQRIANRGLLEIQKKTGLPLIVSNDVHYLEPGHYDAHDVMLCLQTGTTITDPKRLRYGASQFYLKSGSEMLELFREYPEALANTVDICERCNVELRLNKDLHFPMYQVPEGYTQKQYLIKLGKEGLRKRYGIADIDKPKNPDEKQVAERFYYELSIIENTGFINYFLVVWDFIKFARDNRIPVGPGRGSGAGCIVAYALGITDIDPLAYSLIFERFLNPERVSAPDFDIDFCMNRRGEVIEYVKEKYGRENVAQIITFGTLGAKTVIRDLARVLEIPLPDADRLAKMIPDDPKMTLEKAIKENPEFRDAIEHDENAKRIMKYAPVLEGLPRNPGTHAAGVVIGEKPLIEIVPLARDKDEEPVTQYEMGPLGEVGLLKMDFLGLKTLTIIQEACDLVKAGKGKELDPSVFPMEDDETFELLNKGDTVAVFQVESKGMRDLLRRIALSKFEELIAMIALYRPGPMNMLDDFIGRKHGKVKIEYDHPLLKDILEETYGVMVYQEQVQQASNVLAGYSLGEGDILRRAMGKKKPEEMQSQREKFIKGCKEKNNIPPDLAGRIFDNIERFAGYGFNKSHSAAYAVVSWQTAYLKAHYPVEFMAANLSIEINNSERIAELINECQIMGIDILPPSVNESGVRFTPTGHAIRFGMAGIKNVGQAAVETIVRERDSNGPFKGLIDFCKRVSGTIANRKMVESLVRSGAFDFTGFPRSRLFGAIEYAMSIAASASRDRELGQFSLFEQPGMEPAEEEKEDLPEAQPWPESMELAAEKELIGFYISGHPLTSHKWALDLYSQAGIHDIAKMDNRAETRIGGLVSQFRKLYTKKNQEPMCIFTLEHLDGLIDVVVFPQAFRDFGVYIRDEAPVMICGEVKREEDTVKLLANEVYPLPELHKHFAERVSLHIPATRADDDFFRKLKTVLRKHPGDVPLILCIVKPGGDKIFINTDRDYKVAPDQAFVKEVERLLGEDSVYIAVNPRPCLRARKQRSFRPAART